VIGYAQSKYVAIYLWHGAKRHVLCRELILKNFLICARQKYEALGYCFYIVMKKKRKKRKHQKKKRSFVSFLCKLFAKMTFLGLAFLAVSYFYLNQKWTPLIDAKIEQRQASSSVRVFARTRHNKKQWIQSLNSGRLEERKTLKLSEVNPMLLQAIMRLEDPRFLKHGGFDPLGIMRAIFVALKSFKFSQGGSTITQQLVKNVLLTSERTLTRKYKEIILAAILEKKYHKEEILSAYVNEVYLGQKGGREVRGFASASEHYFSKNQKKLEIHEVALLAAMVAGPGYYSPYKAEERTLLRRNKVLKILFDSKQIVKKEYDQALSQKLLPDSARKENLIDASYAIEKIKQELIGLYGEEKVIAGGFEVETSLDTELQMIAEKSLKKFSKANPKTQALFIAANPEDCRVQVYLGGTTYSSSQFDRIRHSKRPLGSIVKPLLLSALIEKHPREVNLSSQVEDSAFSWNYDSGRATWSPKNYDLKYRGSVSVREIIEKSLNVPFVKLFYRFEPNGLLFDYFQKMNSWGLSVPKNRALPSSLLGAVEATPWNILSAYVHFVRKSLGVDEKCSLTLLEQNEDASENREELSFEDTNVKSSLQNATLLSVEAMQGALRRGTSRSLGVKLPGNQAWGAKTGTSSDKRDSWHVAVSPELVTLSWVGKDNNDKTKFTGASGALKIAESVILQQALRKEFQYGWSWPQTEELEWRGYSKNKSCALNSGNIEGSSRVKSEKSGLPLDLIYGSELYTMELYSDQSMPVSCD